MNQGWRVFSCAIVLSWIWASFLLTLAASQQTPDNLTTLGQMPEWRRLDVHQGRLTRSAFEKALQVYSPDGALYHYLNLDDQALRLYGDTEKTRPIWTLHFTSENGLATPSSYRIQPAFLREWIGATADKPLQGQRICLDPGHIGGLWSNLEERYFRIRKERPIEEAELNLITCLHLERLLTEAGAEVVWTKKDYEPVTPLRPSDLEWEGIQLLFRRMPQAYEKLSRSKLLYEANWNAELAFYRPAEIGARAQRVAEGNPNLTICLHYNAAPWGNRRRPRLVQANKLIVFVLGTFMKDELAYDDQKFSLMQKWLEGSQDLEIQVATSIAEAMEKKLGFPPENYDSFPGAHRVNGNPYVWSRNLLANRLFPGPTVFVEGPYMNDPSIYARLQAGDFDGEQLVQGKSVRSLYREYAESVAEGIINCYRQGLTNRP
jgi:N-acetylmuramoyl-L-alanine amidase